MCGATSPDQISRTLVMTSDLAFLFWNNVCLLLSLYSYTAEAPEMQMRRLADLAFMFRLYELAYQIYYAAKKDFNNEHAWLHLAGAMVVHNISLNTHTFLLVQLSTFHTSRCFGTRQFIIWQSAQSSCWTTQSENPPVCLLLTVRWQCVRGVFT